MNADSGAATPFDDLVSVREAAALLRVSESTIWRWINSGLLLSYRVGRKRVYVKRTDTEPLIRPARPPSDQGDQFRNMGWQSFPMSSGPLEGDPLEYARALHARQRAKPGWENQRQAWEDINEMRDERSRELD